MKRLKRIVIASLALVAAVAVAAAVWWLQREEGPAAVSLEVAVEQSAAAGSRADASDDSGADLSEPDGADPAADSGADPAADPDGADPAADPADSVGVAGIAGRWQVDAASGSFDLQQATGSFVGFRVDEVLRGLGDFTVVGRTGDVSGAVTLSEGELVSVTAEADLTGLATDSSQRDQRMHQALGTASFPIASFELAESIALPDGAASGEPFSDQAAGDLTIKGVTNRAVFDIEAQLVDDVIVVVGSSPVVFADYGITAPTAPVVISVADNGIIEFQLLLTR